MGGKSGGGDGGAAEQARIKAEQDKAIARLNGLFGVADPSSVVSKKQFTTQRLIPQSLDNNQDGNKQNAFGSAGYEDVFDQQGYDAALKKVGDENAIIKASRDAMYSKVGEDVFNAKKPMLDKSRDNAARQLKFNLFRTGNIGGSNQIDQNYELNDNYNRGLTDLANMRQSTVNNARAADENSRLDLIGRIRAGMNQADALNSASVAQQNNLAKVQDSALAQTVGDYFGGMRYLQNQDQYQKDLSGTLKRFNVNPSAYNGTVGRL
jgi:hypothetical protein